MLSRFRLLAPGALWLGAALSGAATARASSGGSGDVTFTTPADPVGVYDVWEAEVRLCEPGRGNPFSANRLRGTFVSRASGRRLSIEGFCDALDGSLYRLRFAPTEVGEHAFTLRYDDGWRSAETSGSLQSVPGENPGFLRVDPKHPHHFVYEKTGRHFYLLGHTAYHIANPVVPDENWITYLDHISALGFNKVRMLISSGRTRAYWHYRIFPWTGDLRTSTFDQYDVALWQRFDRIVRAMAARGIVADLVFEVDKEGFASRFSDFDVPSEREKAYYLYAVNRLGAFTNVVFNLGNEHLEFHSQAWANTMGGYVKSVDPYGRLLTAHGFSSFPYGWQPWADTVCLQAYAGGSATRAVDDWSSLWYQMIIPYRYAKPVVNDEYGYEEPYPVDSVRKSHWTIAASGGYGSYGSHESLTVRNDEQRLVSYEVADAQVAQIRRFFEKTDYWLLENDQGILTRSDSPAVCLALRGWEYVVYLPNGGSLDLDLAEASGLDLPIEWVDPKTLEATPADPPSTGGASTLSFSSPAPDRILHIGGLVRDEPFDEDFDADSMGSWSARQGSWSAASGVLRQSDPSVGGPTVALAGRTFSSFRLDVDVRVSDASNRWAGVSVRRSEPDDGFWQSGYLVLLRNDRSVEIHEAAPEGFRLLARGMAQVATPGAWNCLTVVARGGSFQIAVNGKRALAFSDDSPAWASGYLSLAGESGVVEFDGIHVRPIFVEDWNDSVSDGLEKLAGSWRERGLAIEEAGGGPDALLAADFPGLYDFTASVDLEIDDRASSESSGLLLSQGPIVWPLAAPAFAAVLSNRGDLGAPTLALLRLDSTGRRTVDAYADSSGSVLRVGERNRLSVSIAGGSLSVSLNGEFLLAYRNRGGSFGAVSIGLLGGRTPTRFDNFAIRDDQQPE